MGYVCIVDKPIIYLNGEIPILRCRAIAFARGSVKRSSI